MRFIFDTQVEEQKYRNSTIHDGTHAGFIRVQTRFMTSSVQRQYIAQIKPTTVTRGLTYCCVLRAAQK